MPEDKERQESKVEGSVNEENVRAETSSDEQNSSTENELQQILEKIATLEKKLEELRKSPKDTEKEEDEVRKKLQELEAFRQKYYQEKIRNSILSAAKEAVDPEAVYVFLSQKAQATEDGRVLVDGKPVEEAVKELLEKKPYLKKVSPRKGSNPPPVVGEPQKPKRPRDIFSEKFGK